MQFFDVGRIIGQSFRILFSNLLPFMFISGLVLLPGLAISLYFAFSRILPGENLVATLILFVSSALTFIATGAISYGVFQQLRGRHAPIADCLGTGLRRLFPVLGVAIVSGLICVAGFILLVVPGMIAYVMLYVAVPSAVVERPGILGALRRSRKLTAGYRWSIFGVIFLIVLISNATMVPVQVAVALNPGNGFAVTLSWIVQVFYTSLAATSMALVYYQLRTIKEQIDVEDIAAVFT